MKRRPLALAGVCLAVGACWFPTDVCGCPPALGIATVAGVVQRADGSPAAGAVVDASLSLVRCGEEEWLVDSPARAAVGNDGWYRYMLRAYSPSDTACLTLTAVDTAGGRQDSVTVTFLRIRLIASHGTRERPHSLRVDFRFP